MFVKLPNFRKLRIWDKGCIRTLECRVLIIDSLRKYLNFLLNRRPSESSSIFWGWLRSYGNHYPATIRYTWLSFPGEECIADQWEHVCYSYRHILATGEHGIPQWLIGNVDTDCLQFWNIMMTDSSKKHRTFLNAGSERKRSGSAARWFLCSVKKSSHSLNYTFSK